MEKRFLVGFCARGFRVLEIKEYLVVNLIRRYFRFSMAVDEAGLFLFRFSCFLVEICML